MTEDTPKNEQLGAFRVEALREAAKIISGDRDAQYGGPEDNFGRIAVLWSTLFGHQFTKEDVAVAMVALKLARYASKSGFQPDTWIDIAGYAGLGYEVGKNAEERAKNDQ